MEGELLLEASLSEAQFDKANRVVRGVVLLTTESKKNRRYPEETIKNAMPLFEGVQAFINHPSTEEIKVGRRDVRKLAGKVESIDFVGGKLKGNVRLLDNENGRLFMQIASEMPEIAGMSQNALGTWRNEGGIQIIEAIKQVYSVDLVANPATTKGIFESADDSGSGDGEGPTTAAAHAALRGIDEPASQADVEADYKMLTDAPDPYV